MVLEFTLIALLFKVLTFSFVQSEVRRENVEHYTNLWAVQLSNNDDGVFQRLRQCEGFEIVHQNHHFPNLYLIIHRRHPRKGKYENKNLTNILLQYNGILWAEQMFLEQLQLDGAKSNYKGLLNDPSFTSQWYLQDNRKKNSDTLKDLNVVRVWSQYNIFGYNIKVAVVDGGIQIDHPDLEDNYDPDYSANFENFRFNDSFFSSKVHGTMVAGVIAMQANNKICGVGVAPLVTLGAVRLFNAPIDDSVSPYQINKALSFRADAVDISTNAWTDINIPKYLKHMDHLVMGALKNGIIVGRKNKGIIFVFSAGNRKPYGGTCAHKSFANSIYTIIVGGVKRNGDTVYYSERCSSILVAAYSGDGNLLLSSDIITTSIKSSCKKNFGGTSAAVPMVSGIAALILEARYNLSWREVQHVFVWTSQVAALAHNEVWSRNKAGFYVSPDFGFGLVDAYLAVTFAKTMQHIPSMNSCVLSIRKMSEAIFSREKVLHIKVSVNGCKNRPSQVNYMEHVQLIVSVEHSRRGAIQILLISPSGTKSLLMDNRRMDKSSVGLDNWVLDTVHFWGESPQGIWSIIFYDTISKSTALKGNVTRAVLLIHGTKNKPSHYSTTRKYYKFSLKQS